MTADQRGHRSSSSKAILTTPPEPSGSCLVTVLGPVLEDWNPTMVGEFERRKARVSKPRRGRMGVASQMVSGASLTDDEDLGYRSDDTVTQEIEKAFEMYDLHGPFGLRL